MRFHPQPADDPSRPDCNEQPGDQVKNGDLPAQETVQEDQGDFIDHRRGDEKGKRHTEGNPCRDKTDKEGDGRT